MTGLELIIIVLIYVASLLLGQRVIALAAPEMQELGFVVAGAAAVTAAAVMYHRRSRARADMGVIVSVGGVLAIAAVMAGLFSHLIWQSLFMPTLSLPIAAVATASAPLLVFPIIRRFYDDTRPIGDAITGGHVAAAAALTFLFLVAAISLPARGRSTVRLVVQRLPGMRVALPDWNVSERNLLFDNGSIRVDDPGGFGRYMSLRWSSGDPVQPHEYVKLLTGDQLPIKDREPVNVSGHEGVTFYLEAPDGSTRACVTIWNCTDDHRSMSLFSFLNAPKEVMIATHNKVLSTVRCHRQSDRATTGAVFPSFVPPQNFQRDPKSPNLLFIGPAGQNVIFEPAVSGRSPVVSGSVSDQVVASMIKQVFAMQELAAVPQMHTVHDLLNHERRIWSATGTTSGGNEVQVEVMVWYCDVRNMTFIGGYATNGEHPLQHAVDILLPAACHTSE